MTGTDTVLTALTAWRNRIVESRIVSAGELRHNPSNFRRHPDAQIAALRGLLNQVGIVAPLTAYYSERAGGALTLIDGEARDTLGGAWPCDILDVNDQEADLILSAYDAITGQATIDPQALMALLGRIEMTAMEDDGLLALLGQMGAEAQKQLPREAVDAEPQIDRAEELRVKWGTATGQIWACGEHRLICGDCTDAGVVARVMGGERAILCLTDPPYSVDYENQEREPGRTTRKEKGDDYIDPLDAGQLLHGFISVMPSDLLVMTYPIDRHFHDLANATHNFEMLYECVWIKNHFAFSIGRRYQQKHEPILIFRRRGGKSSFNVPANQSTVFEYDKPVANQDHPMPKPIELWCKLAEYQSNHGEIVYEPFSGSGTTLIACEQLGRKCRAIEISPAYVAVALQRFADAVGTTPQLLEGL